jgi:hypothetical protein
LYGILNNTGNTYYFFNTTDKKNGAQKR